MARAVLLYLIMIARSLVALLLVGGACVDLPGEAEQLPGDGSSDIATIRELIGRYCTTSLSADFRGIRFANGVRSADVGFFELYQDLDCPEDLMQPCTRTVVDGAHYAKDDQLVLAPEYAESYDERTGDWTDVDIPDFWHKYSFDLSEDELLFDLDDADGTRFKARTVESFEECGIFTP